jgi:hypothetical protein
MNGIERIAAERQRQINVEGFDAEHDDEHVGGELVAAATSYLQSDVTEAVDFYWPWDRSWWKPTPNRIRELEKAGALIAAEIDRLLRDENQ